MDVGSDMIGMVKTNTMDFCKDTTKKLIDYLTQVSYLVLNINPIVPGDRPLIAID